MMRIIKRIALVGGLLAGWLPAARAQRVLLRANVANDTTYENYGPNRAFYNHFYLGYAAVVGPSAGTGAEVEYGRSAELFLGLRNKWRLSQTLALGADLRYSRLAYYLRQNDQKVLPTPAQHHREYLALHQAQAEGFVRINYGRRGNAIGRYVDVGGWGGWVMGSTHFYEDRPGPNGARRQRVSVRGLEYVRRWSYGVGARAGIGRFALVGRYRLADTFTPSTQAYYPELPRWTLGLELSWL
ncbi:hypothetical protein MUN82_08310 [Hymenobacter aerilatus]|uniref:Outer membrane protein beta-barrel domain-containing protein n=1 Tax=Hymenobacter aerilatus TaxID=2932251 RepID=A0A8T9T3C8_9BACT|nr:hypothetical protein [Hymenobacter aerilatus]UOR07090.1 hypothetical protein MUN82_08310 [Hymenobacter aerilatus]